MDRWTEETLDKNQAKEESAVQPIREEAIQWGIARVAELEERFGITSPALVARALGISISLALTFLQTRDSVPINHQQSKNNAVPFWQRTIFRIKK